MTAYPLYNPTSLRAGDKQPVHRYGVLKAGNGVLPDGTLLGRVDDGAVTSAVKSGAANTGNGTVALANPAGLNNSKAGTYKVRFTSATAFTVLDPTGARLADGAAGTAYADQLGLTITAGGTPFVAGDGFDVTIVELNKWVPSVATATDGSQIPRAILHVPDPVDTTGGDVEVPIMVEGEWAWELLVADASWSDVSLRIALQLNNIPLFIRTLGQLG